MASLLTTVMILAAAPQAHAQLKSGFAQSTGISIRVAEMAGATQKQPDGTAPAELFLPGYPNLWVMELQYKPIRMIRIDVRDPKTGQTNKELVWYMVWRGIRRDYTNYFVDADKETIIRQLRDPALQPENPKDPMAKMVFAPHFTLVTEDSDDQEVYRDWVLPEVQAAIARREGIRLQNSVQAIQPVPELAADEKDQKLIEGVAIWRNVNPKTDYVGVFMTGFSNGYRIAKGPGGETVLERKTAYQRFWRPGDEFEQDEQEFRIKGKPQWIYRPEPWSVKWPTRVKTNVEELMITRPDAPPSEILEKGLGGN
jgi:hypothetical protein